MFNWKSTKQKHVVGKHLATCKYLQVTYKILQLLATIANQFHRTTWKQLQVTYQWLQPTYKKLKYL